MIKLEQNASNYYCSKIDRDRMMLMNGLFRPGRIKNEAKVWVWKCKYLYMKTIIVGSTGWNLLADKKTKNGEQK